MSTLRPLRLCGLHAFRFLLPQRRRGRRDYAEKFQIRSLSPNELAMSFVALGDIMPLAYS
jgi:hypothetical protein